MCRSSIDRRAIARDQISFAFLLVCVVLGTDVLQVLLHELASTSVQVATGESVGVSRVWCSGAVLYYLDAAVCAVELTGFSVVSALRHFAHG